MTVIPASTRLAIELSRLEVEWTEGPAVFHWDDHEYLQRVNNNEALSSYLDFVSLVEFLELRGFCTGGSDTHQVELED